MGGLGATVKIEGVDELVLAMRHAPPDLKDALVKAMRRAALPAQARAESAVHWAGGDRGLHVRIRTNAKGAAVGNPSIVAPVIEFGNKAIVSGGKVAPHVRKLHRHPALIAAVESGLPADVELVTAEMERVLDQVLAAAGTKAI